jgi:hypothetical protein
MYNQEKSNAFSASYGVPALLSRFIDPILNEKEIWIVKNFGGCFEADFVFTQIGLCLRWVPLVLAFETIHLNNYTNVGTIKAVILRPPLKSTSSTIAA